MKKIIVYVFFTGISLLVFGFIFRVHNEYAYKMARGSEEQWYFDERTVDRVSSIFEDYREETRRLEEYYKSIRTWNFGMVSYRKDGIKKQAYLCCDDYLDKCYPVKETFFGQAELEWLEVGYDITLLGSLAGDNLWMSGEKLLILQIGRGLEGEACLVYDPYGLMDAKKADENEMAYTIETELEDGWYCVVRRFLYEISR